MKKAPHSRFNLWVQCLLLLIKKAAGLSNNTQVVIKRIYPSSEASCWAQEVALTAGCDQHLSAQHSKHSLNPALPVHTNICRLLTQWVSGPYPAPTVVIYCCISPSGPHGMPSLCAPCFTAPPAIPGATGYRNRRKPLPEVKESCNVIGAELWIQHRVWWWHTYERAYA